MRDITHRTRQRFPSGSSAFRHVTASRIPYAVAILLLLVTLAIFWQVPSYEFVQWDDVLHVFENPYLQSLTWENILAFWREPYAELHIPLTYTFWSLTAALSRAVTAHTAGGTRIDPQFFHTLNLLVRLLTVLVVCRIVRLLLCRVSPRSAVESAPTPL